MATPEPMAATSTPPVTKRNLPLINYRSKNPNLDLWSDLSLTACLWLTSKMGDSMVTVNQPPQAHIQLDLSNTTQCGNTSQQGSVHTYTCSMPQHLEHVILPLKYTNTNHYQRPSFLLIPLKSPSMFVCVHVCVHVCVCLCSCTLTIWGCHHVRRRRESCEEPRPPPHGKSWSCRWSTCRRTWWPWRGCSTSFRPRGLGHQPPPRGSVTWGWTGLINKERQEMKMLKEPDRGKQH